MIVGDSPLVLSYEVLPEAIQIDEIGGTDEFSRIAVICLPDFPSLESDVIDVACRHEVEDMSYGSKERSYKRKTDISAALDACFHSRPDIIVCDARAFVGNEFYLRSIHNTGHNLILVEPEGYRWDTASLEKLLSLAEVVKI